LLDPIPSPPVLFPLTHFLQFLLCFANQIKVIFRYFFMIFVFLLMRFQFFLDLLFDYVLGQTYKKMFHALVSKSSSLTRFAIICSSHICAIV
jgi:hypothetical protein